MPSLIHNPLPPRCVTDAGKKANELHAAAQAAVARVQLARDAGTDALTRYKAAEAALAAEIERGAREGLDIELEQELADAVVSAEKLAAHSVVAGRVRLAEAAAQRAVDAYHAHVRANLVELIGEVADAVHAPTAAYKEALAALEPIREAYAAVRAPIANLLAIAMPQAQAAHAGHGLQAAPDVSRYQLPAEPETPLPLIFTEGPGTPEVEGEQVKAAPRVAGTTPRYAGGVTSD